MNEFLRELPPVPVAFFGELVTARDSVIHGDSKAKWSFDEKPREVAEQYRDGGLLRVTECQLEEAAAKAIELVAWYDAKIRAC